MILVTSIPVRAITLHPIPQHLTTDLLLCMVQAIPLVMDTAMVTLMTAELPLPMDLDTTHMDTPLDMYLAMAMPTSHTMVLVIRASVPTLLWIRRGM